MRKHLYLVIENERHPGRNGGVSVRDSRAPRSSKNEQTTQQMRDIETGDEWEVTHVSLGYVDYDDEDEYEEQIGDDMVDKLGEIDEQHLRDAGLDPDEVFDGGDD